MLINVQFSSALVTWGALQSCQPAMISVVGKTAAENPIAGHGALKHHRMDPMWAEAGTGAHTEEVAPGGMSLRTAPGLLHMPWSRSLSDVCNIAVAGLGLAHMCCSTRSRRPGHKQFQGRANH